MPRSLLLSVILLLSLVPGTSAAQARVQLSADVPVPPLAATRPAAARLIAEHPLLRTIATVAGSAGGYALAQSQDDSDDPDDLGMAYAGGAAGAALGGIIFSSANPFRVIMGSAIATLPAAALATYLARSMDDEDQGDIPLIAFSIPQGLLTSALSPNRR